MNRVIASVCVAGAAWLAAGPSAAQPTGSADFSKYVALGDSLTAGVWSGGLAETQQQTSYPALIARQVYGTAVDFEQPLISEPGIPAQLELVSLAGPTILPRGCRDRLDGPCDMGDTCACEVGGGACTTSAECTGQPVNPLLPRPYDNLAIPGADAGDVVSRTGCEPIGPSDPEFNPFFAIVLRNDIACGTGQETTVLEQALLLEPTFATVWVGPNDVLAAATDGVICESGPAGIEAAGGCSPVNLTSVESFAADYATLIDTLDAAGVQLAVANIPDVTTIPYVDTIPPVVVDPATGQPVLDTRGQPIPLIGVVQGLAQTLSPADRVLLPASAALAQGIGLPVQVGGAGRPLPDELVLDATEVETIRQRIAAFNEIIAAEAAGAGAALFDVHALLGGVADEGLAIGGVEFRTDFLTGGLFSYDGIHLTRLGYAVVANGFIRAINARYGAQIPLVTLTPFVFGTAGGDPVRLSEAEAAGFVFFGAEAGGVLPHPHRPHRARPRLEPSADRPASRPRR